jgi:hypothetical protein
MSKYRSLLFLILTVFSMQVSCIEPKSAPSLAARQQNHLPVIENLSYAKDVFNTETILVCIASDIDGDNLTYRWSADAGSIKGDGANVLWIPPSNLGTYPITVVVADGKGGEAKETINIRVLTNADGTATPTIAVNLKLGDPQLVVIDSKRARIWTTTDIICIVENTDGDQLTYTWSANGGKITGKDVEEGKANRIGWTAPGAQADSTIDVVVADSQGRQAKGQVNIQVFCCGN